MPEELTERPMFIICRRTKSGPSHVPLAMKRACCECREEVWLAPSGAKIQHEKGAALVCGACTIKMFAQRDAMLDTAPTPEQLREIEEWERGKKTKQG